MWTTLREFYLQGKGLQEIVCGNDVKPPTKDVTLKKWNIKARKAMFAIKSTIEEEMLQCIKNVKSLKKLGILCNDFFKEEQHEATASRE